MDEKARLLLLQACRRRPLLYVDWFSSVTDGSRWEPMVVDEDNVQKKNKDNVIRKPKNQRRPAPFRLLGTHSNPTIF